MSVESKLDSLRNELEGLFRTTPKDKITSVQARLLELDNLMTQTHNEIEQITKDMFSVNDGDMYKGRLDMHNEDLDEKNNKLVEILTEARDLIIGVI